MSSVREDEWRERGVDELREKWWGKYKGGL